MQNEAQSTEVAGEGAQGAKERQLANIVRGTIPRPLVFLIRFVEPADAKEAEVAKKYGTTTGKVADIRKGRNFAYIDEAYRPSAEDKAAALKWLKQVPDYDAAGTDGAVNEVERMDAASESDVAALVAKRASVRKANADARGTEGEGESEGNGATAPASAKAPRAPRAKAKGSEATAEDAKGLMS
jgi:hypothetical protein